MEAHLGYPKHDPIGRDCGNSRYGTRPKTSPDPTGRRPTTLGHALETTLNAFDLHFEGRIPH